jgi:hypothetical protein
MTDEAITDDGVAETITEDEEAQAQEKVYERDFEEIENEAEEDTSGEEAESGSDDESEESEDDEAVPLENHEFSFGGHKISVAKSDMTPEIAEEVDKFSKSIWADYTKKSQVNAEMNKSLEGREAALSKLSNINGEVLDVYSRGLAIRQELGRLQGEQQDLQTRFGLQSLLQSDDQAIRDKGRELSDALSNKTAEFNATVSKVSELEHGMTERLRTDNVRRFNEGRVMMQKRIPDFEKNHANDVVEYVVSSYGIPKEHAASWPLNVPAAQMAFKAMQWDRLQSKSKGKAGKPIRNVVPTSTRKIKASPSKGQKKLGGIKDPEAYRAAWAKQNKNK